MEGLGVLLVVVAAFLANLPAVIEQWHSDRAGFIKTIWLLGLYFLYIGLGLAVLFLVRPPADASEDKALLLTGFIVGFILYGGLILMRVVPRYREPPAWLMRFGIADIVLIGATLSCLAGYLWT
jgi:hypothetical protein